MGRPYPSRRYDHIVVVAHSPYGFDDFTLIVRNDFDPLQVNTQFETVLGYEISKPQRWSDQSEPN
jgi:hypothetical protein